MLPSAMASVQESFYQRKPVECGGQRIVNTDGTLMEDCMTRQLWDMIDQCWYQSLFAPTKTPLQLGIASSRSTTTRLIARIRGETWRHRYTRMFLVATLLLATPPWLHCGFVLCFCIIRMNRNARFSLGSVGENSCRADPGIFNAGCQVRHGGSVEMLKRWRSRGVHLGANSVGWNESSGYSYSSSSSQLRPIPFMPSQLFQQLAVSQLELLASSLTFPANKRDSGMSKIRCMALYLPQENIKTGQLEFLPAVLYPHPDKERIFIASDAETGMAPSLPPTLTKLPGFAHATTLLPRYPMVSSTSSAVDDDDNNNFLDDVSSSAAGVGIVEEVFCELQNNRNGGAALSVPLFSGPQTIGVLLVSPAEPPSKSAATNRFDPQHQPVSKDHSHSSVWTTQDRQQVARAAKSLAIAFSMDLERTSLQQHNSQVSQALSDSLHQVKNPLQALRTYGKILQRKIADQSSDTDPRKSTPSSPRNGSFESPHYFTELAAQLLVQSDRLADRLKPVDALVESLGRNGFSDQGQRTKGLLALNPAKPPLLTAQNHKALVLRRQAAAEAIAAESTTQRTSTMRDSPNTQDTSAYPTKILEFVRSPPPGPTVQDDVQQWNATVELEGREEASFHGLARRAVIPKENGTGARDNPALSAPMIRDPEIEMAFVGDVLDPIFEPFRAIAAERGISFVIQEVGDELPGIYMRPSALQEAVSNLLDNAFKYVVLANTQPNPDNRAIGSISTFNRTCNEAPQVRVRVMPNGKLLPSGVTILIEDNGPGIRPNERERIFQRGFRSDVTKSIDGTGIGLDIARSLIQQMGGTLKVGDRRAYWGALDGALMEIVLIRSSPQF